ncbi:hypothetical protein M758_8G016500 [Ceratodon purpureus]|nr:hypothetical protein M758_8G016500 [Ceratodon purpureus]
MLMRTDEHMEPSKRTPRQTQESAPIGRGPAADDALSRGGWHPHSHHPHLSATPAPLPPCKLPPSPSSTLQSILRQALDLTPNKGRRHPPPSPAMAAVASTSAVASPCFLQRPLATPAALRASARPVSGLPALRMPKIVCSAEKKESAKTEEVNGLPQLAAAVTSAATMAYAHPVFALVDERLSGEGTGLGLGVSNPKLTWILVGVTALVWALFFTYSSKLPEGDDDSGLDL